MLLKSVWKICKKSPEINQKDALRFAMKNRRKTEVTMKMTVKMTVKTRRKDQTNLMRTAATLIPSSSKTSQLPTFGRLVKFGVRS